MWVGELESDAVMDVRTPVGGSAPGGGAGGAAVRWGRRSGWPGAPTWRVRVEEWERFPGDRPTREEMAEFGEAPVWEQRLVYADDIYL